MIHLGLAVAVLQKTAAFVGQATTRRPMIGSAREFGFARHSHGKVASMSRNNLEKDQESLEIQPSSQTPKSRRQVLANICRNSLAAIILGTTVDISSFPANAYDKAYPLELVEPELGDIQGGRERHVEKIKAEEANRVSPLELGPGYKPLSSILWGASLWFLAGSRSNPIVTPLANLVFDETKEAWLKDRNDGLFADIPLAMYALLAITFAAAGFAFDSILVLLTEGDRNVVLQLAGVTLIFGGSLELGRIASGEKKQTRAESDRSYELEKEFSEFAASRLKPGGDCHRNEVVKAFRRYYGKYRVDSEQYPLGDLEIERLLRAWSKEQQASIEMSSAGFYTGIQINREADAFVKR